MNKCIYDPWLEEDINNIVFDPSIDWQLFRGCSFYITGATGLIGSLAIKALIRANTHYALNIRIIAQVRKLQKVVSLFSSYSAQIEDGTLKFMQGDLSCPQSIPFADFVLHCASPTSSKYFISNPVETINSLYCGTDQILSNCVDKHVSGMVYVSSMEVYGNQSFFSDPVSESQIGYINPLAIRSCYPEGKRICECLCAAYAAEFNVPVTIARLAQTFGAGISLHESRVFAQFARSVINNTDIVLHTAGQSEGNYCYTSDVIRALFLLLISGTRGEAYNVSNESSHMTILEMAELVANDVAHGTIKVIFDIPSQDHRFGYAPDVKLKMSTEKIQALGWKPYVGLIESYERMISSLKLQMEGIE